MSDGLKCSSCSEIHLDYEKVGRRTVDGAYHAGIIETYECGRCGATTEVCRR